MLYCSNFPESFFFIKFLFNAFLEWSVTSDLQQSIMLTGQGYYLIFWGVEFSLSQKQPFAGAQMIYNFTVLL